MYYKLMINVYLLLPKIRLTLIKNIIYNLNIMKIKV